MGKSERTIIREERVKAYQERYREKKRQERLEAEIKRNRPEEIYYNLDLDGERPTCASFGCGRKLALIESLAGNVCTKCM